MLTQKKCDIINTTKIIFCAIEKLFLLKNSRALYFFKKYTTRKMKGGEQPMAAKKKAAKKKVAKKAVKKVAKKKAAKKKKQ